MDDDERALALAIGTMIVNKKVHFFILLQLLLQMLLQMLLQISTFFLLSDRKNFVMLRKKFSTDGRLVTKMICQVGLLMKR